METINAEELKKNEESDQETMRKDLGQNEEIKIDVEEEIKNNEESNREFKLLKNNKFNEIETEQLEFEKKELELENFLRLALCNNYNINIYDRKGNRLYYGKTPLIKVLRNEKLMEYEGNVKIRIYDPENTKTWQFYYDLNEIKYYDVFDFKDDNDKDNDRDISFDDLDDDDDNEDENEDNEDDNVVDLKDEKVILILDKVLRKLDEIDLRISNVENRDLLVTTSKANPNEYEDVNKGIKTLYDIERLVSKRVETISKNNGNGNGNNNGHSSSNESKGITIDEYQSALKKGIKLGKLLSGGKNDQILEIVKELGPDLISTVGDIAVAFKGGKRNKDKNKDEEKDEKEKADSFLKKLRTELIESIKSKKFNAKKFATYLTNEYPNVIKGIKQNNKTVMKWLNSIKEIYEREISLLIEEIK